MVANWGGLEIGGGSTPQNPSVLYVNCLQYWDVAIKHEKSFAACVDVVA
jgi:hypothetical protein